MKKYSRIYMVVLITVCLLITMLTASGCLPKNEKVTFSATVMRVDEGAVLVRPAEESPERKSADLILVRLSKAKVTDAKGDKLTDSSLSVGTKVDVTYGGAIAESYPAQINDCSKLVAYVGNAQLPNPMIAFDTPDFTFVAGYALAGMPDVVSTDGIWLIAGKTAQLDLSTPDGAEGMLRCAKTSQEDISGLYGMQFEQQMTKTYGDVQAEISFTKDKKALARWQRGGYDFVLWFPEIETQDFLTLAEPIIAGVVATEGA